MPTPLFAYECSVWVGVEQERSENVHKTDDETNDKHPLVSHGEAHVDTSTNAEDSERNSDAGREVCGVN